MFKVLYGTIQPKMYLLCHCEASLLYCTVVKLLLTYGIYGFTTKKRNNDQHRLVDSKSNHGS